VRVLGESGAGLVSVSGGRHAMGGQQFATGSLHIDTRDLCRVGPLDAERGLVHAEAGVPWPELIGAIRRLNSPDQPQWGIRQKQTGASDLTLGGALASNVHGRGLAMRPIVEDVESFTLVGPDNEPRLCSRVENPELFSLVIGGYGLFGVVTGVTLRLSARRKVRRVVDIIRTEEAIGRMTAARDDGVLYGDYQFDIDHESAHFLGRGVFSRYVPVEADTPIPANQRRFTPELWVELLRLARTDKGAAFDRYAGYYLSTSGQVYHTDTHQLSTYVPGYHTSLDDLPREAQGTEMITELYVPRDDLAAFMGDAAVAIRRLDGRITYGTVRLIDREDETFLPWARQDFACIVFNVLTRHDEPGIDRSRSVCRALIDIALDLRGSFFLTYHRWARPDQVRRAYPEIGEFLRKKLEFDPGERFASEWYRHMRGGWDPSTIPDA
jgi:FAD/FMN-containing dehydrogenase